MRILFLIFLTVHALTDVLPALAQNKAREPLRLIRADEYRRSVENGMSVEKISGNAVFKKGGTTLTCQSATRYTDTGETELIGDVLITEPGRTLQAARVYYYMNEDRALATQDVVMVDENKTLHADSVFYYFKNKLADARGHVKLFDDKTELTARNVLYDKLNGTADAFGLARLEDKDENTVLTAGKINYLTELDTLVAELDPQLTRSDTANGETMIVRSTLMTGNTFNGVYYATDSVSVDKGGMHAKADSLVFDAASDIVTLDGDPTVTQSGETLIGKRILLLLEDRRITHIYVPKKAEAVSIRDVRARTPVTAHDTTDTLSSDTLSVVPELTISQVTDRLTGNSLRMNVEGNRITRITVGGMATSRYHAVEDSVLQGRNVVSGDTITIDFDDNALSTITVEGGAQGVFYPDRYNSSVDTTIEYSAGTIRYNVLSRRTDLIRGSSVKYQNLALDAGRIDVDWNTSILTADGIWQPAPDSVMDATGDSLIYVGMPRLTQRGTEPVTGDKMEYNLKSKRGRVTEGTTMYQDGFYRGKTIDKMSSRVMTVSRGYYTTCDLEENPHFYFKSNRMKLILSDKVIARPVWMYVMGVPVFALPYGVFPNRGGRHSGFIMPTYGKSASEGRYLRGMGYYWSGSNYHDATFLMDFYDKSGFLFRMNSKYKLRYRLNGGLSGSFTRKNLRTGQRKRRWDLHWSHSQTIDPTLKMSASANFASDKSFYQDLSSNRDTRLNQQLRSNLTLNKRFLDSNNSISVNLSRTENLQTGNINETLPAFTFRAGRRQFIPAGEGKDSRWYNSAYFAYSANGDRRRDVTVTEAGGVSTSTERIRRKINHRITVNSPQKMFNYITFDPSLNYTESWIDEWKEPLTDSTGSYVLLDENRKVRSVTRKSFRTRRTFSTGARLSTKLYGNFSPGIGSISAVRHVITPSLGFSYTPDFSKQFFGHDWKYIITRPAGIDSADTTISFDSFEGSAIGATSARELKSLSFGVSNTFQAKLNEGEENEKKIELFIMNFSGGYNYTAEKRRMRNLSSTLRTSLVPGLNFDVSASHSFYRWKNGAITEEFMTIPRLTNLSMSTSFSLSGSGDKDTGVPGTPEDTTEYDTDQRFEDTRLFGSSEEKWKLNSSVRFNINKNNPDNTQKTFWLRSGLSFNPTKNWSVRYNANFDLIKKTITNHDLYIRRDLHCWDFGFQWTPSGPGAGYYLRINVKSPHLKDVKIEDRGGRGSVLGY